MNRANGMATSFSNSATVIGDDLGEEMTHMLADLFYIEMLQVTES